MAAAGGAGAEPGAGDGGWDDGGVVGGLGSAVVERRGLQVRCQAPGWLRFAGVVFPWARLWVLRVCVEVPDTKSPSCVFALWALQYNVCVELPSRRGPYRLPAARGVWSKGLMSELHGGSG